MATTPSEDPEALSPRGEPRPSKAGRRRRSRWVLLLFGLGVGVFCALYGPAWMGYLLMSRAMDRLVAGDHAGAAADAAWALWWLPNSDSALSVRGTVGVRSPDPAGPKQAVSDFEKLVDRHPDEPRFWVALAGARQRLAQCATDPAEAASLQRRAIDDCTQAVKLAHPSYFPLRNQRAYMRAVAGLDLPAALVDIDEALQLLRVRPPLSPDEILIAAEQESAFLDTRAYVLYRLNRPKEALPDMERSLELFRKLNRGSPAERLKAIASSATGSTGATSTGAGSTSAASSDAVTATAAVTSAATSAQSDGGSPFARPGANRESDQSEAVLLHHRGLIRRALGDTAGAEADLSQAEKLGYDPCKGVF